MLALANTFQWKEVLGGAHATATRVTLTERFVPKVTSLEVIGDRQEPNYRELLIQRPQCHYRYHLIRVRYNLTTR